MTAREFLNKYNFITEYDFEAMHFSCIDEMVKGLNEASSLPMIPTYIGTEGKLKEDTPCVIVDAGGTNLRVGNAAAHNGIITVSNIATCRMPGLDKEITTKEFFDSIALFMNNVLRNGTDIGFCFSYSVEMGEDKDGILTEFSKEVKVSDVNRIKVGQALLDAIKQTDNTKRKIVVLNDTAATLLGGKAICDNSKFSSYIGFIYGTGINICYIESCLNIGKIRKNNGSMIINTEMANFDKFALSEFDIKHIKATENGFVHVFEKMTSGRYISDIFVEIIKTAMEEKLMEKIVDSDKLTSINTRMVSDFLNGEENNYISSLFSPYDESFLREVAECIINRAANMCAIVLSSVIIKTGCGKEKPVAIIAEGTTFYKLPSFREKFEGYMHKFLDDKNLHYEIIKGEGLNNIGSAYAILTDE